MKNIFSVIFMNFWGFDFIIFIAAAVTGYLYYSLRKYVRMLNAKMNPKVFAPDGEASKQQVDIDLLSLREKDLVGMCDRTSRKYSVYINMTGIFPLLGILGTVISLLGLVSDSSNMTGNFYGALTSTFWGLVFAIIFKFLDGIISAKIEENERNVSLFLKRKSNSMNERQNYEQIPEK